MNKCLMLSVVLNKIQTFPSAFRPLATKWHDKHGCTRLLVLSGFTVTVIHMNMSSKKSHKKKKNIKQKKEEEMPRLRSQIGVVNALPVSFSDVFEVKLRKRDEKKLCRNEIASLINHFLLKMMSLKLSRMRWMCFRIMCAAMKFNAENHEPATKDNVSHRLISRATHYTYLITRWNNIDVLEMFIIIGNKMAPFSCRWRWH